MSKAIDQDKNQQLRERSEYLIDYYGIRKDYLSSACDIDKSEFHKWLTAKKDFRRPNVERVEEGLKKYSALE